MYVTIEDHEQNKDRDRDDIENILVSALRDALLGYVDRRAAAAVDYVDKLLESERILFRRVAIYVAGVYSRQLDGLVKNSSPRNTSDTTISMKCITCSRIASQDLMKRINKKKGGISLRKPWLMPGITVKGTCNK